MKNMCYVCGYMFYKGEKQVCPNCVSENNRNTLEYSNMINEMASDTGILVGYIMSRFNLPIDNIKDLNWLINQLAHFASSMHKIGAEFGINIMRKMN